MKNMLMWLRQQHAWQELTTLIVLGLAVPIILAQITALKISWQVLVSMCYWIVALIYGTQFLGYLGNGYLLQQMLRIADERLSLGRSSLIVIGSVNIVLMGLVFLGYTTNYTAYALWQSICFPQLVCLLVGTK